MIFIKIDRNTITVSIDIILNNIICTIKVFNILRCRGLARVDFFYDDEAKIWFVNEINTIPGFTPISIFPKLWNASGMSYEDLIDTLIQNALIDSPME